MKAYAADSFCAHQSLAMKLKPIVVINKIDRPGARPLQVLDDVLELFMDLGADDDQLIFRWYMPPGQLCGYDRKPRTVKICSLCLI